MIPYGKQEFNQADIDSVVNVLKSDFLTQGPQIPLFEKRSQDLVEAYHDAGQFYWGKAEAFKLQQPLFSSAASPYILPRHLVQDIDTKEDWKRAELMFQVLKHSGELV